MSRRPLLLLVLSLAVLIRAGTALAGGGNYVFAGGTAAEQANVKAALDASSFDWSIVPAQITIRIGRDYPSAAWRGTISLDSNVVDAGQLAWGTIMHEYAHQVDYVVLDDAKRTILQSAIGGRSWWFQPDLVHSDLTSERFASTLAWAYWPKPANLLNPAELGVESGAMAPAKFRTLLNRLIGVPDPLNRASAELRSPH
jgi:hypothetical protein